MKKLCFLALAVPMMFTGCVTVDSIFGEADAPVSAVALQALQTREFDATPDQAFQAVISTFQDYGYAVTSADKATGLIMGKTTSDATINLGYTRVEYNKASAFIQQISQNRVKIRVSIIKFPLQAHTARLEKRKWFARSHRFIKTSSIRSSSRSS